jgi:hypothetical protein
MFVGFAGYKYRPGVGSIPNLADAFKPVSTIFQVLTNLSSPGSSGQEFSYNYQVQDCKSLCPSFDRLEEDTNYVAVSVAAKAFRKAREKLNIASTIPGS